MLIALWVLLISSVINAKKSPLITEFEWENFDYVWKSEAQKNWYIANGLYNPERMAPIDVDRSLDGRTFVTIIRAPGVPATLHTVSTIQNESGPLLQPYPEWSWYEHIDPCQRIINVYRIAIDECNRLWVLDTGSINDKYICPAKLLAFDLNSDKLIYWQDLNNNVSRNKKGRGLLITPIVETYGPKCEDTTIYIADVQGRGLIVWKNRKTIRLEGDVYNPQKEHSLFTIANESFYLGDGVLGMALSPSFTPEGQRYLFFRPLASTSMYAANTQNLKNAFFNNSIDYIRAVDVLPSQAAAQAFSSDGTLFYGLTKQIAIGCWNIRNPLSSKFFKIALRDYDRLQFTSGMKVIRNPLNNYEETLILMTNRLQKIYNGTMKLNETNFRILTAPVRNLLKETKCNIN